MLVRLDIWAGFHDCRVDLAEDLARAASIVPSSPYFRHGVRHEE